MFYLPLSTITRSLGVLLETTIYFLGLMSTRGPPLSFLWRSFNIGLTKMICFTFLPCELLSLGIMGDLVVLTPSRDLIGLSVIWIGWTFVSKLLAYLYLRSGLTITLFYWSTYLLTSNILLLLSNFSRCGSLTLLAWVLSKPVGILVLVVAPYFCFLRSSRPWRNL